MVPVGDGAWVLAIFEIGNELSTFQATVVRATSPPLWTFADDVFSNTLDLPDAGSNMAWYAPVGLSSAMGDVPSGLIGYADPDYALVRTFAGTGVIVDQTRPQSDGFFALAASWPGQIVFSRGSRTLQTQALGGRHGPGQEIVRLSSRRPDRAATSTAARFVDRFLDGGSLSIPDELWLNRESAQIATALGTVIQTGTWDRAGEARSQTLAGQPPQVSHAFPIQGVEGKGWLTVRMQLKQGRWRVSSIGYVAEEAISERSSPS